MIPKDLHVTRMGNKRTIFPKDSTSMVEFREIYLNLEENSLTKNVGYSEGNGYPVITFEYL